MWNALSAPPNDMIDRATSPEGVDRLAQSAAEIPMPVVTCTVAFTAYLLLVRLFAARWSFTRGLDESILFARRGLKKQKSPKKHERPAKPARSSER